MPKNGFAHETIAVSLTKGMIAKNQGQFPDEPNSVSYDLALQAFKSEPATPEAIAVVALAKDPSVRRSLMKKAFDLSRRQKLATGWLVLDSGARNDVTSVLEYYDTILRISSSSADVIMPALANALINDNFIEPGAAMLSHNPPWADSFWRYVIATPKALSNAADLRLRLHELDGPKDPNQDKALIAALANNNLFHNALKLYILLSESTKTPDLIQNHEFRSDSHYPPMDWKLFSNGEYGASIDRGSLNLSAIRNSGGIFARQLVMLPKKTLTLQVKFSQVVLPDNDLYLGLSCAEDIKNKPRNVRIALAGDSVTRTIDNRESLCDFYWLDIAGRSADDGEGFDFAIASVSLRSQ
ncbi:MAG: hypothetical protein ABJL11_11385 [Parasphingorhabdus sp.]